MATQKMMKPTLYLYKIANHRLNINNNKKLEFKMPKRHKINQKTGVNTLALSHNDLPSVLNSF